MVQVLGNGSRIAVNIFLLVAVWFMVDQSFSSKKFIKTWMTVFFYGTLFTLIAYAINGNLQIKRLIQSCFPILGRPLWFASSYLILMAISPFLRKILEWPKRNLKLLVLILAVFCLLIPTVTAFSDSFMESTTWFIFVFLFIGYIKKHVYPFYNILKDRGLLASGV